MTVRRVSLGRNNCLIWPTGTKFTLSWVKKDDYPSRHQLDITEGPKPNSFFVLFPEDDVDFELTIDNSDGTRIVKFKVAVNGDNEEKHSFVAEQRSYDPIKTWFSGGRKLHFKSQCTLAGQALVSKIAKETGVSFAEASETAGNIVFTPYVAKEKKKVVVADPCVSSSSFNPFRTQDKKKNKEPGEITVYINLLGARIFDITARPSMTIEDLKGLLQDKKGIPPNQQRLIVAGKQLEDRYVLKDYFIHDGSTIHMIRNLRGGGEAREGEAAAARLEDYTEINTILKELKIRDVSPGAGKASWSTSRSRGIVTYGDKCDQTFKQYKGFVEDEDFKIEPFTLILMLDPTLKVSCNCE